jgi:hypothetical protein
VTLHGGYVDPCEVVWKPLTCRECGAAVERGPLGSLYNPDGSFHAHDDADPNAVFCLRTE